MANTQAYDTATIRAVKGFTVQAPSYNSYSSAYYNASPVTLVKFFISPNFKLNLFGHKTLGNCDIHLERKISVIDEMKQDKILLKPKV